MENIATDSDEEVKKKVEDWFDVLAADFYDSGI
jgi:hypothetical protein